MSTTGTTIDEMRPGVVTLKPRSEQEQEYRYVHLLPIFSSDRYPPLAPYDHVDPGQRALLHSNPHAFLDGATEGIRELETPAVIDAIKHRRQTPPHVPP